MAGTITQSLVIVGNGDNLRATNKELTISWVADASNGSVPTLLLAEHAGWWITKVVTNPGSTAPTAYGITLVDSDGADIADGALAARSTTASEMVLLAAQIPNSGITFTLTGNSTNSATGTCKIFLNK